MLMPVSQIVRLGTGALSPQQLTDFALEADRERRRALTAGDLRTAVVALRERNALLELAHPGA